MHLDSIYIHNQCRGWKKINAYVFFMGCINILSSPYVSLIAVHYNQHEVYGGAGIALNIDYCNAVPLGVPGRGLKRLQLVLNSAASCGNVLLLHSYTYTGSPSISPFTTKCSCLAPLYLSIAYCNHILPHAHSVPLTATCSLSL